MAKRVVLVAGHGGNPYDPGSNGNGYREAEVVRQIANALQTKLKGKVDLYVYDQSKDLYRTKEWSKFTKNDEVIELHMNAYNGKALGTETLIHSSLSADGMDSGINAALEKYFTKRGIKKRSDLGNMNNFKALGISYRLVEFCFIDNASDMKIFTSKFDAIMTDTANAIIKQVGGSGTASTGNTSTTTETAVSGELYRVRKSWTDPASQKGAYTVLANAKETADKNKGYYVFDKSGKVVYTPSGTSTTSNTGSNTTNAWSFSKTSVSYGQDWLNGKYGLKMVVDNKWGANTKAGAIKGLQTEIKVTADGIYGAKSKAATPVLKRGSKGNMVMILQIMLIGHGYSVGSAGIDGDYGAGTESAVIKFQKAKRLSQDGRAGKDTFGSLSK